jgi:hypothetical protein
MFSHEKNSYPHMHCKVTVQKQVLGRFGLKTAQGAETISTIGNHLTHNKIGLCWNSVMQQLPDKTAHLRWSRAFPYTLENLRVPLSFDRRKILQL